MFPSCIIFLSSCFVDPAWSLLDHFVLESIAHWVWAHFWPPTQVFVSTRKKLSNNFEICCLLVDLIIIHPRFVSQVSNDVDSLLIVAGTASVLNDSLNNVTMQKASGSEKVLYSLTCVLL